MATEYHRPAQLRVENVAAADELKIFVAQLFGHRLDFLDGVGRLPGDGERILVRVGGVNLDPLLEIFLAESFSHEERDGIGLLARGAARAPDSNQIIRFFVGQYPRHDRFRKTFPRGRITKKGSDIDENRVEECREFFGMNFQIVDVVGKGINIEGLHALRYPAHQAGPLVAGDIAAEAMAQVFNQMLKLDVGFGRRRHPTSPLTTKVTSAEEISSSGSTKSTLPVCTAAPGIPKNSELFSSWTITVPPIFFIALTPIAPSLPVPERTTAMERSLKLAATDSKSKSAEGRTKWTSSDCDRDKVPSGLTSRCLLGGAI